MTNAETLQKLEQGYRMPCPPGCPQALYTIMLACWSTDEDERPTFICLQYQLEDYFSPNPY